MGIDSESSSQNEGEGRKTHNFLFALFFCAVACIAYYQFMVNTAIIEVDLNVSQNSQFAVYWATEGGGYSEKQVATVTVYPGKENYSFYLTNISKVVRLRVDTHNYAGEVTLKRLAIHQEGYEAIVLKDRESFSRLVPLQQIEQMRIDDNGLWVTSVGNDPSFELIVPPRYLGVDICWLLVRMVLVSLVTFAVVYACTPFVENLTLVPLLLFGVWLLVLIMAGTSKQNVHPDEYVHIAATSYYAEHWLPPVVEDPAIRDTYSVYGVSRLNCHEIYYFFSGKIYKSLQFLDMPPCFAYRFFNVAMFGCIFLMSIRSVYARIAALPYLVSSQIWYVFSYCGSDAFALFISFLATCQLIDPNSFLHRYLKGGGALLRFGGLVLLPLLLGTVFILKINFYPFVGLFYLMLGVRMYFFEEYYWEKKDALKRLILITVLAFSLLGMRVGVDYLVNGPDRSVKIASVQEELGEYKYKKSTPPEERVSTVYMQDRGVAFKDLITKYHWDIQTFHSSFGVFGYMTIVSPSHYYYIVKWFGTALMLFILISSFTRGGVIGAGVTGVVFSLSLVLILAALQRSWMIDFQPQGRYLLPIIPMFGVCLGHNIKAIDRRVLLFLVGSMYLLGLYSFIFQGLLRIPTILY
ncbi:MAG: hypothetical protein COA36_15500 [Desulfotalea sp.]|nr:MAG: hypothetical protein COA36_15500 [Desulfotalea sp.]